MINVKEVTLRPLRVALIDVTQFVSSVIETAWRCGLIATRCQRYFIVVINLEHVPPSLLRLEPIWIRNVVLFEPIFEY